MTVLRRPARWPDPSAASSFVDVTDVFVGRIYILYHVTNRQAADDILLNGFKLGKPV
jgi:hypothetical protein